MKRILILGWLFLTCLGLLACAPQTDEPMPAAFAEVTVFAPDSQSPTVSLPGSSAAPNPADAQPNGDLLVVYEKSGSLWKWQAGAVSQLTQGAQDSRPQISTDGQLLAFLRGAELWMVDSSGQNLRKVFAGQGAQPQQFEFAPGSHLLYFNTSAQDGAPRFDLYLADAGANALHALLAPGQGGVFTFAPDGSLLALAQPERLMTVRPDGSALKVVYTFSKTQAAQGDYFPAVAWLENAYGFKTVMPGAAGRPALLMFVMADGSPAAQLAEFPAVAPAINDVFIAPDGSKVAYLSEQGDTLELHVIDAGTADRVYFSHARGKFGLLGWTPDSQGLLTWLDDPRSAWLLSGEQQVALSDAAYATEIRWVSRDTYLFISEGELRLRRLGQPGQVIDSGVGSYMALPLR